MKDLYNENLRHRAEHCGAHLKFQHSEDKEGRRIHLWGQPGLYMQFQAKQGCIARPYLKKKKMKKTLEDEKTSYACGLE